MRMESAWVWLMLPPLLLWVCWLSRRSYAQLRPAARWGSAAIRLAMVVALLAAWSEPSLMRRLDRAHAIFLLDVSRSISTENTSAAMSDIDRIAREIASRGRDRMSVIAFGARPRVLLAPKSGWDGWSEQLTELVNYQTSLPQLHRERTQAVSSAASESAIKSLADRISAVERFRDDVAGDVTDLPGAIRLALNCGAVDERPTIYLFTDANFNRGSWEDAWNAARAAGASIVTVALDRPIPPEVACVQLTPPQTVRVNQGFSADLRLASTVTSAAQVVVYSDGVAVQTLPVELRPGENLLRISGLGFQEKGFHTIEAVVRAEADTHVENNRVASLVTVPGEVRVLYVDSDESQQSYLKSALELEGMQVEARPASGVPQALTEMLSFDAFILSNVPADRLTMRQMQMIKAYVQDFGGGFVMLGGDQSFGLGGYYNTPVEEVLPVKMPIRKDVTRPSLAIVLVIDKSGSMDGVKMQLAKRAAVATSEAINPRDQIGVVGFDSQSQVILELTPAGDRATITGQIASLEAGGGTMLYPALQDARDRLNQSSARRKHVIVLSDGQTEGFGYPEFAQAMAADGITISAVGIGAGADMQLLESIAAAGGGRAYFTNDFYSIPQIFTREALRASNNMLVERLVQPTVSADDELLHEIESEELPALTGYVATTPKESAKMILVSDSGDPILAKWRWGLGMAAAFTSETKPRWAEDWIRWADFAKFWSQFIRSLAGQELARDVTVELSHELEAGGVRLLADVRDSSGGFISDQSMELSMHDPQAGSQRLEIRREGPGLFSAVVPRITWGRGQQFAWHMPNARGGGLTVPYGFVYSFSPEFARLAVDEDVLAQIESRGSASGGEVMRVGHAAFRDVPAISSERIRLWPALLMAALLLAPFDILCRRLG